MPPTVGQHLGSAELPIERGKVREFARALLDDDPVFVETAAADAGPAPLTFSMALAHWLDESDGGISRLGLDLRRLLHGGTSWEYVRPLCAGDELKAERRVADVATKEGKRGGAMTVVEIETVYRDADGGVVLRQRDTLLERRAP